MMDNLSIRAAEDFIHAGYPVDAEAILLCELDGVESDVQEDCERVNDILLKAGATDVRLAQDEAERVRFWAVAKCVPGGRTYLPGLLLHGWHHPASRTAWRTGRHCPFIAAI